MSKSPMLLRLVLFAVVGAIITFAVYSVLKPGHALPIYHPADLKPELTDARSRATKGEHHILDFRLFDQNGDTITLANTHGKVRVADFFFTTCTSICPKMSMQMERVQEAFKDDDRVVLLSHSVTPEMDSVPVLAEYAQLHGADQRRWHLLTGDRRQIYRLARRSWFAALDDGDGGQDDFVHTENFVLADTLGRLRGFYDGTKAEDVDRLIADMHTLLEE
ncbi:MAG: SCO family protein [Flavobacteriales bacterium]